MAQNIIFGDQNLLFESGVTVTPSSEAAGYDADNLLKPHPSLAWRIPTLATGGGAPYVIVAFPSHRTFDLVAPLYGVVTGHRNMVEPTDDLSDWTGNEAGIGTIAGGPVSGLVPGTEGLADPVPYTPLRDTTTNSAQHNIERTFYVQQWSPGAGDSVTVSVSCYVADFTATRNFQLSILRSTSQAYINFDVAGGAIDSSGASGSFSGLSAYDVVSLGSGWYRTGFSVQFDAQSIGSKNYTARLALLDGSFADTYVGALFNGVYVGGPLIEMTDSLNPWVPSSGETGAHWMLSYEDAVLGDDYIIPWRPFPLRTSMRGWRDSSGWLHSYYKMASSEIRTGVRLYVSDLDNANGYIDLPNFYIGPSFQPAHNLKSITLVPYDADPRVSETAGGQEYVEALPGGQSWRLAFEQQVTADAARFSEMYRKCGKSIPVLIILDADEATYGQEFGVLWARILDMTLSDRQWNETKQDFTWSVNMTVKEYLP